MWSVAIGTSRAVVTAARLQQPRRGQKLWVRLPSSTAVIHVEAVIK